MLRVCARYYHSYTHLILAQGIVREPTVWGFIASTYSCTHGIGRATVLICHHTPGLCGHGPRSEAHVVRQDLHPGHRHPARIFADRARICLQSCSIPNHGENPHVLVSLIIRLREIR